MIKKQYEVSYNMLAGILKDVTDQQAEFQLELANNNIKWQLGHMLLANESFIFGKNSEANILGKKLGQFYAPGTSPQGFNGEETSFEELKADLNDQLERIVNNIDAQMESTESNNIVSMTTFAETIPFAVTHTNYHIGQIQLLKNMITKLD
ncbi:DinB family protein [Mammaliicoccus sp. Dog046]|uniref:DinB family protein n=1 Tax=Mammaliicoccus sp. Dog046 TaxID=3034233 RepID=UPI002B25C148|nr:DinB family protein [Mammaliicoccus sp. Dog046]WQK86029.1 DinB family protein [Mammaliicoccus sp. Dog046]